MRGPVSVLVVSLWLAATPASLADPLGERIWRSENVNPHQIPGDMTALFETLRLHGVLPTRAVTADGRTPELVLRAEAQLFGAHFPVELDRLLCSLNPRVCSCEGQPAGSACRWTNRAGDPIVVPAVQFETYVTPRTQRRRPDESMQSAVDRARGCEAYDPDCRVFISHLNRQGVDDLEAMRGEIILPTLAVLARLPAEIVTPAVERALGPQLVPLIEAESRTSAAGQQQGASESAETSPAMVEPAVLQQISHPRANGDGAAVPRLVNVVVMDDRVDRDHCAFGATSDVVVYNLGEADPQSSAQPRPPCGTSEKAELAAWEHGTHIAGLLGARDPRHGLVGVNPEARLVAYEVMDLIRLPNPRGPHLVAEKMNQAVRNGAEVFNLSFSYPARGSDPIQDRIAHLEQQVFVAAAGNDSQDLTLGCRVLPACLGARLGNVISVLALDGDRLVRVAPGRGSNYGADLDLAAPGQDILSTISGNRLARMSGTSQAAPLVAGAVSLLLAADSKLRPLQIKNRLIATSDLLPDLTDKARGGRLNVARALAFTNAHISTRDGREIRGSVVNSPEMQVYFRRGSRLATQLGWIWRLVRHDDDTYTVFYQRDGDGDSIVTKATRLRLETASAELDVETLGADGAVVNERIALSSVNDFVAALER